MAAVLRSAALSAIFSHWSVCVVGQAAAAGIWLAGMICEGRGGLARSRRSPSTWTTHLCVSEAQRETASQFLRYAETPSRPRPAVALQSRTRAQSLA